MGVFLCRTLWEEVDGRHDCQWLWKERHCRPYTLKWPNPQIEMSLKVQRVSTFRTLCEKQTKLSYPFLFPEPLLYPHN